MKVTLYKDEESLPGNIHQFVDDAVRTAFKYESGEFLVNPTKLYKKNSGRITPAVVNSAEYFSKKFQKALRDQGWETDFSINGQEIDGYIEITVDDCQVMSIQESNFYKQISELNPKSNDFIKNIILLHSMYYIREKFLIKKIFNKKLFDPQVRTFKIRLGLEFETGNIASSFRALSKLNNIYDSNHLDVGIFVTSRNKTTSTKIWPTSNRNGSIEELENRNFQHEFRLPIIVYGFEPDGWNINVGFLHKNGERYNIDGQIEIINEKGKSYEYYTNHALYKPINNDLFC